MTNHLTYIHQKGPFQINCSRAIFSNEEIELIEKYGHWFEALVSGILSPITEEQKAFIQVFKNHEKPFTPEQVAWFKYIKRLELEQNNPEKFNLNYTSDAEDPFFSRSDWKTMRAWRNH